MVLEMVLVVLAVVLVALGAPYMYGSDGPGGDSGGPGGGSGGPGGGSETVFGTDVRNRQCSEQCSEPTKGGGEGIGLGFPRLPGPPPGLPGPPPGQKERAPDLRTTGKPKEKMLKPVID